MKIALALLHADASRGGAERYTIDLAAALAREGHAVSLAATTFRDVPAGAREVRLDARGVTRTRRYVRYLDGLDAHLSAEDYDIVHAMLPVRHCDVYHPHAGLAAAAIRSTAPLTRPFNPRRARFAAVERRLLTGPRPPVVLCLSEYVKRSVRPFYPLDDAHLPILFNAVDLDHFAPDPGPRPPREEVNALFVGQDFHRKGLMEALAAFARVNDPRLRLTVVGKLRKSMRLPSMGERVRFVGSVADARPFYREADFFVLPTRHDPCSLVVLEALAMGLPVISTRFNGACEIMTPGVHGFVLDDPTDIPALAEAMQELLDDASRSRMARACIQLRPKLSYDHHLRALAAIYARVLEMRVAGARPSCP